MPLRLPELVGRAMVDAEFLAELQRATDAVLARYELTDDESAAVRTALGRMTQQPVDRRAQELRTVLLRRVAT